MIDTFASWALEGLEPSDEDIKLGQKYIDGDMTPEEIINYFNAKYGVVATNVDSSLRVDDGTSL
jgi:hypothetical protein